MAEWEDGFSTTRKHREQDVNDDGADGLPLSLGRSLGMQGQIRWGGANPLRDPASVSGGPQGFVRIVPKLSNQGEAMSPTANYAMQQMSDPKHHDRARPANVDVG